MVVDFHAIGDCILWNQLASPIPQEREAASRELGERLVMSTPELERQLLDWLSAQVTECRCAEGLLPLVWAKLRNPEMALPAVSAVAGSIRYPSHITATLISWLYDVDTPLSLSEQGMTNIVPDDLDKSRFGQISAHAARYLTAPLIPPAWRSTFRDDYLRGFALIDRRLDRPPLDKMRFGQSGSAYIPNYQPLAMDGLISSLYRAITRGLMRDPTPSPVWWIAPTDRPHPILEKLLNARSLPAIIDELTSLRSDIYVPAHLNARLSESQDRILDLRIRAFYQRLNDERGTPTVSEVLASFGQPQLTVEPDDLTLTDRARDASSWTVELNGWDVVPASLAISTTFPTPWHADLFLREAGLPFIPWSSSVRADGSRRSLNVESEDQAISTTEYWITRRDLERQFDVSAPVGTVTLMKTECLSRVAASLRSVPAFAIELLTYEREYAYKDWETHTDVAFLGTTSLVIP
jgi:hypothetical protein